MYVMPVATLWRRFYSRDFPGRRSSTCSHIAIGGSFGIFPVVSFCRLAASRNPSGVISRGPLVPCTFSRGPFFRTFALLYGSLNEKLKR